MQYVFNFHQIGCFKGLLKALIDLGRNWYLYNSTVSFVTYVVCAKLTVPENVSEMRISVFFFTYGWQLNLGKGGFNILWYMKNNYVKDSNYT